MADIKVVERALKDKGFSDFKFLSGQEVIVQQWVRFKCRFGCPTYGRKGGCPPNVPPVDECREFFREYRSIAVIHIAVKLGKPEMRAEWSRRTNLELLQVERDAFLAGFHKAFLLFMDECRVCNACEARREDCLSPEQARPCPESLGVDVFGTVKNLGFPIEVLTDYDQEMNRYAFLLIE